MKKFYALFAAALISVCAFASKDVVPSDDVIKAACDYEAGQVCVCIYVPGDMACNDIVLTGTYNDWSDDPAKCSKFKALEGYDGWYVIAVEDDGLDAEGKPYENLQEKPVMLDVDGNFNWNYQIGAATKIRGGVSVVQGAYSGEIDLKTYGTDAPNVYTVDSWKDNPCTAVYHNYKFEVISAGCDGYAVPFVIGDMTNWGWQQMQVDVDKTMELGVPCYYLYIKTAEGQRYQIGSGLMDAEGKISVAPDWVADAYLQMKVEGNWVRMPGEVEDNLLTHEDVVISYDLRVDTLRWARCADKLEYTINAKLPECGAPAEVELVGSWGEGTWDKGIVMTLENGVYTASVTASEGSEFKFRSAGSWTNEIIAYNAKEDKEETAGAEHFGSETTINIDYSDADKYHWSKCGAEATSVVVSLIAPANAPEKVEIIGTFDGWAGTEMTLENGQWVALVEASDVDAFKFRQAGTWDNEILVSDGNGGWTSMDNINFVDVWQDGEEGVKVVTLDFSDAAAYKWTLSEAQGIENIVLTEKVQKVVVDGVIYIVRDNKMFNIHGAQVR